MDASQSLSDLLPTAARTSTFTSIDVIGSTALKDGEPEQDIVYTFLAYHQLVTDLAYTHHGEVIHITGDGMMCRFQKAEDAARHAADLLNALPAFNKKHNRLRGQISLRLGLHTGPVLENQQLEGGRIISKTLDIAAKLQQSAGANRACASESTVTEVPNGEKFFHRVGWNAALQVNVYELGGRAAARTKNRQLPDPARVLLVEQEPDEQSTLRKALFGRRHEVFGVFSQTQAGLLFQAWKPHVVLISVDLPWDSGWDLLRGTRGEAAYSEVPIIAVSRQTTGDIVQRCFRLGANGFLRKPMDPPQILKRVDLVLREFYL